MKDYFDFFKTLHDEKQPVGNLGRGTHYSIFRSPTFLSENLKQLNSVYYHDFSVVWDEDHDERIIPVIQQMYFENVLSPAIFLGERKGSMIVLVGTQHSNRFKEDYQSKVQEICEKTEDDYWPVYVETIESAHNGIINDTATKVELYLNNIISLWDLGIKPIPTERK